MPEAETIIDLQQRKGVAWDIIDEAINSYDEWMMDDDYEAGEKLHQIVARLRERRDLYNTTQ